MPHRSFKTLLLFVSTLANLWGCSTTRVRDRVETCIPDPRNVSFQCVGPQKDPGSCMATGFEWNIGKERCQKTRPFKSPEADKFVCFPADELGKFLQGIK